jgi:hypothetical protein
MIFITSWVGELLPLGYRSRSRLLQKLSSFPYERSELILFYFTQKIYYYNPGTDGVVE